MGNMSGKGWDGERLVRGVADRNNAVGVAGRGQCSAERIEKKT